MSKQRKPLIQWMLTGWLERAQRWDAEEEKLPVHRGSELCGPHRHRTPAGGPGAGHGDRVGRVPEKWADDSLLGEGNAQESFETSSLLIRSLNISNGDTEMKAKIRSPWRFHKPCDIVPSLIPDSNMGLHLSRTAARVGRRRGDCF